MQVLPDYAPAAALPLFQRDLLGKGGHFYGDLYWLLLFCLQVALLLDFFLLGLVGLLLAPGLLGVAGLGSHASLAHVEAAHAVAVGTLRHCLALHLDG